ncbi:MAG: PASTA domain-containing protein [Phycisphaerae bacterium]|nr:PASTA domain-containing protein [Phycisphaerae bacterium]NIS52355.1 PASTA domain-containing protein [Phycisphaerae bacterium]NIU57560.1 PASTA domain-containing protein [Phycisphaerae bacterium]NIW94058.1 PASTA domain-containing protein [Phycisphaerae bacterium]
MRTSITNIARMFGWLKGSIRIWLMYVIVCALGLCQFGCSYAQLERATINDQLVRKGESLEIEVTREGELITPELGMALQKGDDIKTPAGVTALIKFSDGSEIIMMPETHITIESIRLWFGKIIASVKGRFKAKTEYVTAGVRSTLFLMSVDKNIQSTLTMIEGSVVLTSNENRWHSIPLQSGREAIILSSQKPEIKTIPREEYNKILKTINEAKQSLKGTSALLLVPKVIGLSFFSPEENDVDYVLASAGFRIGNVTRTIEGDSPIDTVVRQRPEYGKGLHRGGSVDIWVRARAVEVPNVMGQHRNEAMTVIRRARLSVHGDVKETITGKYDTGVVNAQSPNAGQRVAEGTAVRLTVEAESIVVPDVIGKSVEQAETLIRERRLKVRTMALGPKLGLKNPQVMKQNPTPGNRVKPGTTVTLHFATPGVQVPNLIGQNEREATSLLRQRNLGVGYISREYNNKYPSYVVMRQSPAAGQVVNSGSTVALTVSRGRLKTQVPVLIGKSEQEARKLLEGAKLQVGFVSRQESGEPVGVVIYQKPAAGQDVEPGTKVDFTVSRGII